MKRVLLDEGVPRTLAAALRDRGVDATAFPNAWKQLPDAALLGRASAEGFSVIVTGDKNMPFQQSLASSSPSVLILSRVDRKDVAENAARIAKLLGGLTPGRFFILGKDGRLVSARQP